MRDIVITSIICFTIIVCFTIWYSGYAESERQYGMKIGIEAGKEDKRVQEYEKRWRGLFNQPSQSKNNP